MKAKVEATETGLTRELVQDYDAAQDTYPPLTDAEERRIDVLCRVWSEWIVSPNGVAWLRRITENVKINRPYDTGEAR